MSNEEITNEQYQQDKETVDKFLDGQTDKFDLNAFKRLVTSELIVHNAFTENKALGFKRCEIIKMIECPYRHKIKILKLSDYMYLKSGYYQRLIDYFVNQSLFNYTVDTKINDISAYAANRQKGFKRNHIKFCHEAEKFDMGNVGNQILRRLYRNDVCYAFVTEDDFKISYFFLDPMYCEIYSVLNGNVFQYGLKLGKLTKKIITSFPLPLQELIENYIESEREAGAPYSKIRFMPMPVENSLCLKYNNDLPYLYPPFLHMIADILLIDDYKDLAKTQSINDAYKLLTMKIPTKDGQITLDNKSIAIFTELVLKTVQNNIGVITTPFDMETEEFSASNSDNRDNVSNAISWAFKDAGVSEALMSGATSGSELKLSIVNDSGGVFRLYRHIEDWINFQMKMRKFIYANNAYEFEYKLLDMTTFNKDEVKDEELKMAQNGIPNKFKLCAANGISPCKALGNTYAENVMYADLFENWKPLKTSYTQSSSSDDVGGRPTVDDGDLSTTGENARDNDSNNPDNRIK